MNRFRTKSLQDIIKLLFTDADIEYQIPYLKLQTKGLAENYKSSPVPKITTQVPPRKLHTKAQP